jgi:hypothetical protein
MSSFDDETRWHVRTTLLVAPTSETQKWDLESNLLLGTQVIAAGLVTG